MKATESITLLSTACSILASCDSDLDIQPKEKRLSETAATKLITHQSRPAQSPEASSGRTGLHDYPSRKPTLCLAAFVSTRDQPSQRAIPNALSAHRESCVSSLTIYM